MLIISTLAICSFFGFFEYFGVSKRLSKSAAIFTVSLLFVMVAFNRMNDDYLNYKFTFLYEAYQSNFEFGYVFLINTVKSFGFNYEAIVFLTGCLLIFTLLKINQTNRHTNLLIFLYCCFPLIYDLNQVRNLIMYLIIIISLGFIANGKQMKYYIGVLIAFSFHRLALFYLPLYFLCKKSRKAFMKIIWTLFFVLLLTSPVIVNILNGIFPYKMGAYLSNKPGMGIIIPFVYVAIDIFTVWWVDKRITHRLEEKEKKKMEVLYRFVWFSLISLPFSFYFLEILRIQRSSLLVKYLYCTLAMSYLSKTDKFKTIILLLLSVIIQLLVTNYEGDFVLFDYLDANPLGYFIKEFL